MVLGIKRMMYLKAYVLEEMYQRATGKVAPLRQAIFHSIDSKVEDLHYASFKEVSRDARISGPETEEIVYSNN